MEIVNDKNTRENVDTSLLRKLKGIYDKHFTKVTAAVVGVGIHAYTLSLNNNHLYDIADDLADGRYFKGALKISVPFLLPYCISSFAMWKARGENSSTQNP